jgi:hypothetical protein
MAKPEYFVICENVLNDGGRVSLINIFDVINVAAFPAAIPKFCFAFTFLLDKEFNEKDEIQFSIDILKPSEDLLFKAEGRANVKEIKEAKGRSKKISGAIDLSGGLIIDKPGLYNANLTIEDKLVSSTYFEVKVP